MAVITLEYDGRSAAIKKLIEVILSLGAKQVKPEPNEITKKAIQDAMNGNVIHCESFEDFVQKVHE